MVFITIVTGVNKPTYNEGLFKPKPGGALKYISNCWQIDSPTPKKYIKLWEINQRMEITIQLYILLYLYQGDLYHESCNVLYYIVFAGGPACRDHHAVNAQIACSHLPYNIAGLSALYAQLIFVQKDTTCRHALVPLAGLCTSYHMFPPCQGGGHVHAATCMLYTHYVQYLACVCVYLDCSIWTDAAACVLCRWRIPVRLAVVRYHNLKVCQLFAVCVWLSAAVDTHPHVAS